MNVRSLSFWLMLCVVCMSNALAQTRGAEVGGYLGGAWYFGDLNTSLTMRNAGAAGGFQFRYVLGPRLALGARLGYAQLYGDDRWADNDFQQSRGLNFRSHLIDFTPELEFNFLPFKHGDPRENFTPYLGMGFTVFRFQPTARYFRPTGRNQINGEPYFAEYFSPNLRENRTEGQLPGEEYQLTSSGLAFTFGFKYNLTSDWSVNFFATTRSLFTDYIDDVSTTYPDIQQLQINGSTTSDLVFIDPTGSVPLGAPLQRGQSSNNDSYTTIGVSLTYFLGQLKCPEVKF